MSFIHDKSDSYFDNSRKEKLKSDPRIPKYARANVLYVEKSNDPNNPNFIKIVATVKNNRIYNNFSENPINPSDTENIKSNIVLWNISKITVVPQEKEIVSEPAPGDEISVLLITNEETRNLNIDGYFIRIISSKTNAQNNTNGKKENNNLQQSHRGAKNGIVGTAPTEEEQQRYDVKISIASPIDQTINKINSISEELQYDFYKNIILKNGGAFFEENTKRNVLAIRVPDPVDRANGAYNDRMVMVWKDKQGKKTVRTYVANTEPNTVKEEGLTSISRANDQFYYFGWSGHPKYKRSFVHENIKTYDLYRKRNLEQNKGGPGQAHLIHKGGTTSTNSEGCQTFPPNEWNRFWDDYYSDKPEEKEKTAYNHQLKKSAVPGRMTYYIINYDQLDREIVKQANV